MVEGQASNLYTSDTDTWSTTSTSQGSDEEPLVGSHFPFGSRTHLVSPESVISVASERLFLFDVLSICVCPMGVVGCFSALSTTSSLIKINKMAAFFHLSFLHIVGFHRILYLCLINLSDGEHKE
jgi:hypothetical protein